MARISLIIIFMIWLSWSPGEEATAMVGPTHGYTALFAAMGALLLGMGLYSRVMARRMTGPSFYRDLYQFNRLMRICRFAIPVWFGVAVFGMDWPAVVRRMVLPSFPLALDAPLMLVGTMPAILAMVMLWWAAYPAERALRDQSMLDKANHGVPVHAAPSLLQYLVANVRMQLLFMYVPVLAILGLRDLVAVGLHFAKVEVSSAQDLMLSLGCVVPVLLVTPALLVFVLPTQRMPDSPLRRRLEELCQRHGLRVNNVLLWRTHSSVGNAAVMGMIPGVRYLLVTDLLLEAMPEDQVVAVFAHEIGHVVHRHLLWMAACGLCLVLAASGPADSLLDWMSGHIRVPHPYDAILTLAVSAPVFLLLFGFVVRRMERQADVFAARTAPELLPGRSEDGQQRLTEYGPGETFVQSPGAKLVCAALENVALINNVPVVAREWLHGSIAWRMKFLNHISDDPYRTWQYDQFMRRLYGAILFFLVAMGAWTAWNALHG